MNADGSGQTQLVDTHGDDACPTWSPDGTRIVFTSHERDVSFIFVIDADGSKETMLTPGIAVDQDPDWSPDGKWIVFASNRDQGNDLYLISAAGSDAVNLTQSPSVREWSPIWLPDGYIVADD